MDTIDHSVVPLYIFFSVIAPNGFPRVQQNRNYELSKLTIQEGKGKARLSNELSCKKIITNFILSLVGTAPIGSIKIETFFYGPSALEVFTLVNVIN